MRECSSLHILRYGFNPGAVLTGNIVEDERVWGSTEWGIGYVSPFDAPPHGQDAKSTVMAFA